jgi:cyclic beta-1,2-glucan synthetase
MAAAPVSAIAVAILVVVLRPAAMAGALPLLILWLVSPEIALRISRPHARLGAVPLSDEERRRLRRLARRTWLFFESFVGPGDQWLPPDHFQEQPRGVLARRTSPTNIGLLHLAEISAHDLGYTGLLSVVLRLRNTMETLARMERNGGHFYNWYDTRNLAPL